MSLFILWGVSGKIERIESDGSNRQNLITGLTQPQGMDIYLPSGHIYFIDRGTNKIQRSDFDGSNVVDIVTTGMIDSQGLKIDTINNKLIWIDSSTDNIKRCNLDGSDIEIIVSGLTFGEDVDIDFNNNKLYWTDSVIKTINKCDLDGSNQEVVLGGLNLPNCLEIDHINNKIYFTDAGAGTIERCDLDGTSLETVLGSLTIPEGLSINVENNIMAWAEFGNGANGTLRTATLDGLSGTILAGSLSDAQRVFMFQEATYFTIDFFVNGIDEKLNNIDLVITGGELVSDNIDFFVSGVIETGVISNSSYLNIRGISAPQDSSCPILDPTAAIQISDELIGIYQSRIDALINQLGKNILLEFDPIKDPCPNCEFDILKQKSNGIYKAGGPIPFNRGNRCPYCKDKGFLLTEVNKCIKALIKWNPKEIKDYGISIKKYNNIVRVKAFLSDSDDISKAKTAIIDYDIINKFKNRVKLIRGPVPVGLREDRYCISFWNLLDN